MSVLRKLVRSFEDSDFIDCDEYLKKAKAFGVSVKHFVSDSKDDAIKYLDKCNYKLHKPRNSNDSLHKKYYDFELARKKHINACYQLSHTDDRVVRDLCFYINMPNPFKCIIRGRSLPDVESSEYDYGLI